MPTASKSVDLIFKSRIINHLSFWLSILLLLAYHGSLFGGNFYANLTNMCALLPVQMAAAYLMVYVQIPRWLFRGAWFKFIGSSILIAYLLSALGRLSIIYIAEPIIGMDNIQESLGEIFSDPAYLIQVYTTSVYLPTLVFFLIKMTKERFTQQHQMDILEKEKRSAELNFLKAQMNPHFLFNTLNNLYALAKSGSEQTPEMILKLSEILDYTLYECNAEKVSILREWELIENYADLQALRNQNQMTIVLNQEIDEMDRLIAPLLLIALVENAFKYAVGNHSNSPDIKISLVLKKGQLIFTVFNTKATNAVVSKGKKEGIGVKNIKQQLNLMYPNRHQLELDNQKDFHNAKLTIEL